MTPNLSDLLERVKAASGRKVVTSYINPPIPTRRFDWCAHFDGDEEAGGYGYGATEAEAIKDFLDSRDEGIDAAPLATHPMVFLLSSDEGVLFDPQGKFHGWLMRRHPDGMWISVRKLEAVDPEDHPLIRAMQRKPSPLTMLCDMKADGSCESAGSDFCEFECPNRERIGEAALQASPAAGVTNEQDQ